MEVLSKEQSKKLRERQILERARAIYPEFPPGLITPSECPDFCIEGDSGSIGIEITSLFRLPMNTPAHHKQVVSLAEGKFYESAMAPPVFVNIGFLSDEQCERENQKGWRWLIDKNSGSKKDKLANSLTDFVRRHAAAERFGTFSDREMDGQLHADTLPTGFEVIHVSASQVRAPWQCGESANMSLDTSHLLVDLHGIITKKNEKLRNYRANAVGIPIWLLIYSGLSLCESVWVPPSIGVWRFPSDFDRVLLLSIERSRVFEIATFNPAEIQGTGTQI
jgi:hypothetical protein